MSTTRDQSTRWIKSTHSDGQGGECVEWAPSLSAAGSVPVRDSKRPGGPRLHLTPHAWTTFVTALKR
ncbi:DUF397 domain-containing protein [Streptomyces sp. NPDC001941]|uniref:DUF397 domain-containing protein n=1 Tax=Streptomyces sp. NPDC001941 TaxID=3154659 RepID=UPI00332B4A07